MRKITGLIMLWMTLLQGVQLAAPMPAAAAYNTDIQTAFLGIDYQRSENIRVIIDGKQLSFEVYPQVVRNTTLVPMRDIFEALGLTVDWDNDLQTARGSGPDGSISFVIGSSTALVNNQAKDLTVPASIIAGKTMIPLRFLAENMGYKVVWVGASNLILISKSDIIEWRYEGFETIPPYKEYEVKYVNGIRAAETKYTGKNHEVEFYTLYNADGRIVPNVPDFNIESYGKGWLQESPFNGRIYWVDVDVVSDLNGQNRFYDPNTLQVVDSQLLRDNASVGNYLKVQLNQHFFALDARKALGIDPNSELATVQDEKLLDGKVIRNADTLLRVTINDQYRGIVTFGNMIGSLFEPETDQIYAVLDQEPRIEFDWSDDIWSRVKGETPWIGMTKDMLLVQLLSRPDMVAETATRFSVYELWVYETESEDSVYLFDNGILAAIL